MRLRHGPLAAALALAALLFAGEALARSSIGIGTADIMAAPSGPFAGLFAIVTLYQREFFDALRHALVAMRTKPGGLAILVGLSFVYGIFHAIGPGHGKAVISSYMLANEVQLKRGILLSFVSALLQAVSALVVVGAGWYVLRGTSVSMTDATDALELGSYVLVAGFGAVLLARKLLSLARRRRLSFALNFEPGLAAAASSLAPKPDAPAGNFVRLLPPRAGMNLRPDPAARLSVPRASDGLDPALCRSADGEECGCGRAHMPDPARLGGRRLSLGSAASAVFATGLRPCAGAIVVLTFALVNALYLGGILSVLAMALGTAITVSVLACLAVFAKDVALKASGRGRFGGMVQDAIELFGALAILLLGLTLVGAALQAG